MTQTSQTPRTDARIGPLGHWPEDDGYWIDLAPGWQNGNDPGCHSIVENTKTEAFRVLKNAKPCDCKECRAALSVRS